MNPATGEFSALLDVPQVAWTAQLNSTVEFGNGVFVSPSQTELITTSSDGSVTSFNAFAGDVVWEYIPPAVNGSNISCFSGMTFTSDNVTNPFMVYSIVDESLEANITTFRSRVVALDMDGALAWISPQLDGVAAGSPQISYNGEYVYLTQSEDNLRGIFSILSVSAGGDLLFQMRNETNPFAPLGIFHNPAEGYYDDPNGVNNTNDLVLWSIAPFLDDNLVDPGGTFAFQFPVSFTDDTGFFFGDPNVDLSYIFLREQIFKGIAPPTITNAGRSAYWPMTISAVLAWVGEEGNSTFHFNRFPFDTAGFARNAINLGQAIFAPPVLSRTRDSTEEVLFGGAAGLEFYSLSFDLTNETVVSTNSTVLAKAVVDPVDRAVYYAESEGTIHQANFDTLQDRWTFTELVDPNLTEAVAGEIDVHPDGDLLYVADTVGAITALRVAEPAQFCTFVQGNVSAVCPLLVRSAGFVPDVNCDCYNFCDLNAVSCCAYGDRTCTAGCQPFQELTAGCEIDCSPPGGPCSNNNDCCSGRCQFGRCFAAACTAKEKVDSDRGGRAGQVKCKTSIVRSGIRRELRKSRVRGYFRGG